MYTCIHIYISTNTQACLSDCAILSALKSPQPPSFPHASTDADLFLVLPCRVPLRNERGPATTTRSALEAEHPRTNDANAPSPSSWRHAHTHANSSAHLGSRARPPRQAPSQGEEDPFPDTSVGAGRGDQGLCTSDGGYAGITPASPGALATSAGGIAASRTIHL